jgi:hypothetical protein
MRDPHNFWDFFDVPAGASLLRDGSVAAADIFAVLGRFPSNDTGPGTFDRNSDPFSTPSTAVPGATRENYHPAYDRGGIVGLNVWNVGPPDGSIAGTDIFAILSQFNHAC